MDCWDQINWFNPPSLHIVVPAWTQSWISNAIICRDIFLWSIEWDVRVVVISKIVDHHCLILLVFVYFRHMKNVRNLSFIKDNMPPVNFSPTGVNQFIQLTIYNIQRQTVNLRTKQVWKEVTCIYISRGTKIKDS
jgi:hypothetical protein